MQLPATRSRREGYRRALEPSQRHFDNFYMPAFGYGVAGIAEGVSKYVRIYSQALRSQALRSHSVQPPVLVQRQY